MKRTMTSDQVRALALSQGAEATIDGKPFNTDRAIVPAAALRARAAPTPSAPPAPRAAETFTRADVDRLLAEQEERFTQRLASMLASIQRPAADDDSIRPVSFQPIYDKDGAITVVNVDYQRVQ